MKRITYLIPHFPSQTAVLFWREIGAVERMGVEVDLVSTRRPNPEEICHVWASEAMARTAYLYPLSVQALLDALGQTILAGPAAWWRCVKAIGGAQGVSLLSRARLVLLMLIGAATAAQARRRGWQHIHVHSCADSLMIAVFAHLLIGIPYSMTLHGPLAHYRGAQHLKWRHAKFAITVTERLKREVLDAVPTARADRIHVAPMGVDLQRFKRSTPYQPPSPGRPVRIVSCGRLHPNKGHQELIRAVARLRSEGIDASLTILGDGPARAMLAGVIRDLSVTDAVNLAGAVDEGRVRDELEQAHVFALGSYDEAIGVATMEAMAMELPVVVTDVGGVAELVGEGVHGRLVAPRDSVAIAEAISHLISESANAIRMGHSASRRVAERFSAEKSAMLIARKTSASAHPNLRRFF